MPSFTILECEISEVQGLVDLLPEDVKGVLALGPTEDGCRVCDAFDRLRDVMDLLREFSPEEELAIWHTGNVQGVGLVYYLRCIYIYQCAGWEG